jgi:glycoside/pentoside/hexuronide:cation symporter, GPH family
LPAHPGTTAGPHIPGRHHPWTIVRVGNKEAMSEERKVDSSQVIPFFEKIGYALGDFASNLFWMPFVLFGNFFYTDVFGISATAVGYMLLVTRIWDTVIDPVMGLIADRTRPRRGLGRYRPYLFWFALPFAVVCSICFYTPHLGPIAKIVYAWVTYTLFCMVYSAINIPYSALMSVMSRDPGERNSTSFFRMIGAQTAGLIISSGLMYMVAKIGGGKEIFQQQRGFFLVMAFFAFVAMICFFVTGKTTRERIEPDLKAQGEIGKDLKNIVGCRAWWLLFFVSFFTIAAFTLRFGVAAYYFKYYADPVAVQQWGLFEGGAVSAFFTFGTVSALLGVVVFSFFAKTIDKKKMYYVLIVSSGLLSIYFYYIPNKNITTIIATQAVFSFLTGPTGAILFAMYTDIAAFMRHQGNSASNGLVMSAGSFAQKFGWAIGGSITSILLGWAGYEANQPQTETVKQIMRFMMSWAPMIACFIGAFFMMIYPLNNARMTVITRELEAKGEK